MIKETKKARQLRRREVTGPALMLKISMYKNYDRYPPIMPMRNRQIRTLSSIAIFCLLIACCVFYWIYQSRCSINFGFGKSGTVCPVLLAIYHSCDQINKNEMGGAYGTYGGQERYIQSFDGKA